MYLWQKADWPDFNRDEQSLIGQLSQASHEQGRLLSKMEVPGVELPCEANLRTLTEDVVKSSEIEGETLAPDQVRLFITKWLGFDIRGLVAADHNVDGVDAAPAIRWSSNEWSCNNVEYSGVN